MKMSYFLLLIFSVLSVSCDSGKKYHDGTPEEKAFKSHRERIESFQDKLNKEFNDSKLTPLLPEDFKNFKQLDFFPIDTSYALMAYFERTPNEKPFMMPTTTNRVVLEVQYGILHFTIDENKYSLAVYQNQELVKQEEYKDYLFLPFMDDTNGEETYGGGRYLDMRIPEKDSVLLDFNTAYNPYCVYNPKFSCPLVPERNYIPVRIPVGIKDFKTKD